MYTGIVDHVAKLISLSKTAAGLVLRFATKFEGLNLGESISIDGVCVTVTDIDDGRFSCDISPETYALTTARFFTLGQAVNVERSLRPQDRMGGHYVMGHVDQCCQLSKCIERDNCVEMTFSGINDLRRYFVPKGSVAINGVSLTLNKITDTTFTVMVIPHTLARTNLKNLAAGDIVNIETDWMVKTVVQQLTLKEMV